jgi:hypothetical protein
VVHLQRRPRSVDPESRILLPDSSGRLLCVRPGTQGGPETILGSTGGGGPR